MFPRTDAEKYGKVTGQTDKNRPRYDKNNDTETSNRITEYLVLG